MNVSLPSQPKCANVGKVEDTTIRLHAWAPRTSIYCLFVSVPNEYHFFSLLYNYVYIHIYIYLNICFNNEVLLITGLYSSFLMAFCALLPDNLVCVYW